MKDFSELREQMVKKQLASRGVWNQAVLNAMKEVPREEFIPKRLVEFAYEDSPLPIDEGQTISQPYIVALMTEALEIDKDDKVLDIGTGSGYAAAVLSRIASEVYTIERHAGLAKAAEELFKKVEYDNIHVLHADGTLGWPENAPFDAIVVAAGGPDIPEPLKEQLSIGGRLVIPTGPTPRLQKLIRLRRVSEDNYQQEDLGSVKFVPLVGAAGWKEEGEKPTPKPAAAEYRKTLPKLIAETGESFSSIAEANLDGLLGRIGDARIVLLGEATHGTAEFYNMRARITQELIKRKNFDIIAVEADWPDASSIDHFIKNTPGEYKEGNPFSRFPTWLWANKQFFNFIQWLRQHNKQIKAHEHHVSFYGLDLYSMHTSIAAVLNYLDRVDPDTAQIARKRYGCLTPWEQDSETYGAVAIQESFKNCEDEVTSILQELMNKRLEYASKDGHRFLDAVQNARLISNAERYYRTLYYGSRRSWNLRDNHMFETIESILNFHGPKSRAVVWEHNSHVGDASATEMGAKGELNVGKLCREKYGEQVYIIGFGTDHGTVAAASEWGGEMEIKKVRPAHINSYERLCHESESESFLLPLNDSESQVYKQMLNSRLERAIGVIYRPETEIQSHYFYASLPKQFDEYIWFEETSAVEPIESEKDKGTRDTFPFGV